MQAPARARAAAIRARGQATANTYGAAGDAIAGSIGAIMDNRASAPQRAALAARQAQEDQLRGLTIQEKQQGMLTQQDALEGGRRVAALLHEKPDASEREIVAAAGNVELGLHLAKALRQEAPKTREVKVKNADGSETIKIVPDVPGEFPSAAPLPETPKKYPVLVAGPDGRPISKLVTEAEMIAGVPAYRAPTAPPTEKAKFWVMRNGKPVRVSEAEYRPGDTPASTREQGRPVTSGDAGRLADFDTSINDLKTLRSTIAPRDQKTGALVESGATGTVAKIGTVLPNFVTNAIGWTTPKEKQATIDRVKQVIGKALEGGVLRKEDEAKYEKILPTIYDAVDVVESKLDGLDKAIAQRKGTTLDALDDAGYDVTQFRARSAQGANGPAGSITVTAPDGSKHDFVTQAQADEFKRLAGMK